MSVIWTVLTVAFCIIEAMTSQLVSIWLAGGAFASLVVSLFTDSYWVQIWVFVIISALLLVLTRPVSKKLKKKHPVRTNVDALIGEKAIVTEDIANLSEQGAIKLNGITWSARSVNGVEIKKGTVVTVEKIEGVKVIVKEFKEE